MRASRLLAALCIMELRVACRQNNPPAFCSDAFSLRSRHQCAARPIGSRLLCGRGVARRAPSLVHDSGDVWEDPLLPSSSFSSSSAKSTGIAYLDVPYEQKDAAKALGAKWDPSAKRWYAPPKRIAKLRRWLKIPAADDDEVNESGSDDEEEGGYIKAADGVGGRRGDVMSGNHGPLPRISGRSYTPRGGRGKMQHSPELGDMVYLRVPYAEKNEAKSMGAWWDPARQAWYVRAKERHAFKWPDLPPEIEYLQGEDRSFGGDELYVDLVPASCWFTNVRSCVDREDWRRLRRLVLGRAEDMCECCGATDDLEVHERWSYNLFVKPPLTHTEAPTSTATHATTPTHNAHEEAPSASGTSVGVSVRRVQRLERLMALCSACHDVTHFGLAELEGRGYEAFEHLTEVRGWSDMQAQAHLHEAYEIWKDASMYDWELDLSLLTTNGIELIELPPSSHERRVMAEEKLRDRQ